LGEGEGEGATGRRGDGAKGDGVKGGGVRVRVRKSVSAMKHAGGG